jgi:YHS domain-containing protein
VSEKTVEYPCGVEIDPQTARWTSEYDGKRYVLCSPGCKRFFDGKPERFLAFVKKLKPGTVHSLCGSPISGDDARRSLEHEGRRITFCADTCIEAFLEDPEGYPETYL